MNQEGQDIIQKLEELLKKMDVPFNRRHINLNNLRWLHRNLGVRNSDNPKFEEAMSLIKLAINHRYYNY